MRQRFPDSFFMGANVNVRLVYEQDGDIPGRGLELADPFEEKQRLENANGQAFAQLALGHLDGGLHVAPDGGRDAIIHEVERGEMAHGLVAHSLGDFLENGQHGALAHG